MNTIFVYDNDDNDTGIWHKGIDAHELVWTAAMSVAEVYGTGVYILRTTNVSGGFATDDGTTYRYEIQETNR